MRKKIIIILCAAAVLAAVICGIGWLVYSHYEASPVDIALEMVEVKSDGTIGDTVSIHIYGEKREYSYQTDELHVQLDPFANLIRIGTGSDFIGGNAAAEMRPFPGEEYLRTGFGALKADARVSTSGELAYSPDFDRWLIEIWKDDDRSYYVGSVSGSYTTEELVEYFRGVIPWDLELVS